MLLDFSGKLPHGGHRGQIQLEAGVRAPVSLELLEDGLEGFGPSTPDDDVVAEAEEGLDGLPPDAAVPARDHHGLAVTFREVI